MVMVALAFGACGDDSGAGDNATTTSAAPAGTAVSSTAASTLACETVGFTPNSEDAASDIRATGLPCDEARAFVMVAGRQTSSGGPSQVEVQGYKCERTRQEQEPLPRSFYECTNNSKKVSFVRS